MIPDEKVEADLDWLRDNVDAAAKARAERIYVEEYARSLKAILMKEFTSETSVAAQEREALASDRYLQHLDAIRDAVEIDERNRFRRESAKATLEAYNAMSYNIRNQKI